jgi:hypothetical protein
VAACYRSFVSIPQAELARRHAGRRARAWLAARLRPPRWLRAEDGASTGGRWAISGAFAGCLGLTLYIAIHSGSLGEADFAMTLGWTIFAAFGATVLFLPFVACYLLWLLLRRAGGARPPLQTRLGAALFTGGFHLGAHLLVTSQLGGSGVLLAAVPLLVGALWGSWLPATVDDWLTPD